VLGMRTPVAARLLLLLGCTMMLTGLGLLVVGMRWFLDRGVPASVALDGTRAISPAHYAAPWTMAVVLVAAAVYLLRGVRDQVF
jgi:hypothetical protein